ncbi:MAG: SDR family oxidoreductase [Phaeodactylibacter sp.]|nr:SDR family oxidoreductase [Phaeodactylibacter sp.]MCB9266464.1 SDR family oxidoreductase [Lewinellaceae bacterium]MCB9289066.1 SDR family oxidoreductase [Lewinellaceae bacterium]
MGKKVVVITGGAQGIGRAVAERLSEEGWQPVALDRDEEAGQEAVSSINGLRFIPCDVSREEGVKRAVDEVLGQYGWISGLINNAGFGITKPLGELSLEEWNQVLSTNLTGAFLCAKYCAPHLEASRGAIVNIASTRAYMSERNTEAYSASKGGLLALTHALAISLGPAVRVNSISPGWIDVTGRRKSRDRKEMDWSREDHEQHPVGRIGRPEDIAGMAAYLLSEEAGFVTGQDFIIDGGMTRKMIYV